MTILYSVFAYTPFLRAAELSTDAILTVAAVLEPPPTLAPAAPEPVHTLAPSDPAHLGWSVRKAPFAGQGACGKEGTKWQCVLEESSRVQGAASHMGRGARGKMHASRCAHRGVRARKKLAQTTQSGNKVGNPLWIPFSVLRKNWSPVRFPIFVPISVSDAFLASILVFSCEQR